MKITAAELLADKRNTRAVLAAEVEELNDINDRLNYDYDRLDEQSKKALSLMKSHVEWNNSELKRVEQERDQLGHVIIAHAKKQAGF